MLKRIEYLNEGITNLRSLKKYINNEILLIKDEENTEDEFEIQESESEYFCKDDLVNINLDGLNFVVHFLYEKGRDDKSKEVIILRTHDSIRCGKIKINDKISSFFSKLYFLVFTERNKKEFAFERLLDEIIENREEYLQLEYNVMVDDLEDKEIG